MTTGQSTNVDASPLQGLDSILTSQQIAELIKKAVPSLKQSKESLQESLEQQQWDVVVMQAHQLKSLVSLFSADALIDGLDMIESLHIEVIKRREFRVSLMTQCEQLINRLESHLPD